MKVLLLLLLCLISLVFVHGNNTKDKLYHFKDENVAKEIFENMIGAKVTSRCGGYLSSNGLAFYEKGEKREVESKELDLSDTAAIQLIIANGGKCDVADKNSKDAFYVHIKCGSGKYKELLKLDGNAPTSFVAHTLILDKTTQKSNCKMKLYSEYTATDTSDAWVLDSIQFIGNVPKSRDTFEYKSGDDVNKVFAWNRGTSEDTCGKTNPLKGIKFTKSGNEVVTPDMNLVKYKKSGALVMLHLRECSGKALSRSKLNLFYSSNYGASYQAAGLVYAQKARENAEYFHVYLPDDALTDHTRIKISSVDAEFGVDHVAIGGTCKHACSGAGACIHGKCKCEKGFSGSTCQEGPSRRGEVIDSFDSADNPDRLFKSFTGAEISSACGSVSGKALMFREAGPVREAITHRLDLSKTQFFSAWISNGGTKCDVADKNSKDSFMVAYSKDGGATWSEPILKLDGNVPAKQFKPYNIPINDDMRKQVIVLKFYSLYTATDTSDVWVVDQLYMAGAIPESRRGKFDYATKSNKIGDVFMWNPGVQIGKCGEEEGLLAAGATPMFYTYDYDLSKLSGKPATLMVYASDCNGKSGSRDVISVEYSLDSGISWSQFGTIYGQTMRGKMTRVFLPAPDELKVARVSLRFTSNINGPWGINKLYLGPACPNGCSTVGDCYDGKCKCDKGFSGTSCEKGDFRRGEVIDSFDPGEGVTESLFKSFTGAEISSACGSVSGKALMFREAGPVREAITHRLDLSKTQFFSAWISNGGTKCDVADKNSKDSFMVAYSKDGGATWSEPILKLDGNVPAKQFKPYNIPINDDMRKQVIVLKFYSLYTATDTSDVWVVDQLYMAGAIPESRRGKFVFDASESKIKDAFMWNPGVQIGKCGEEAKALSAKGDTPMFYTYDYDLSKLKKTGAVLNARLIECEGKADTSNLLKIQYSLNHGMSWTTFSEVSVMKMRKKAYRHLVNLPAEAIAAAVQFRFTSNLPSGQSWGITRIFIGEPCPNGCNGAGDCMLGECICDTGFTGKACESGNTLKGDYIVDTFDDGTSKLFEHLVGAEITSKCGAEEGKALVLRERGPMRYVQSKRLDLKGVHVIQMRVANGGKCDPADLNSKDSLNFYYSLDGGQTYKDPIRKLTGAWNKQFAVLSIPVTEEMRKAPSCVLKIQADYTASDTSDAWVIDNVFLGGKSFDLSAKGFQESFDSEKISSKIIFLPKGTISDSCGKGADGKSTSLVFSGESYFETVDFDTSNGGIVQFWGKACTGKPDQDAGAITLSYSTDFGLSWTSFRSDKMMLLRNWRRGNAILPVLARTKNTRFRISSTYKSSWSIDSFSIQEEICRGNGLCFNHGQCTDRGQCKCDEGFDGVDCRIWKKRKGTNGLDCSIAGDVILLMDGSGSIGKTLHNNNKLWTQYLVERLNIGEGKLHSRVGIIQFGKTVRTELSFTSDMKEIEKVLNDKDRFIGGKTDFIGGMKEAAKLFQKEGREDAGKILIVMSDGAPSGDKSAIVKQAMSLKKKTKVEIFSVGIGKNIKKEILEEISSCIKKRTDDKKCSHEQHFDIVDSADDLEFILDGLTTRVCTTCYGESDIGMVFDMSGSISATDYALIKKFTLDLFSMFEVGSSRFSITQFNTNGYLEVPLIEDVNLLVELVKKLKAKGGGTNIGVGLKVGVDEIMKHGRDDTPNILILLSDGNENAGSAVAVAEEAKKQGIIIFTIGVGSVNEKLLKSISYNGKVLTAKDYKSLADILKQLTATTCGHDQQETSTPLPDPQVIEQQQQIQSLQLQQLPIRQQLQSQQQGLPWPPPQGNSPKDVDAKKCTQWKKELKTSNVADQQFRLQENLRIYCAKVDQGANYSLLSLLTSNYNHKERTRLYKKYQQKRYDK